MSKDCVPGIIIEDERNGIISVKLSRILEEIENGDSFYWDIFWIWAIGDIENPALYGFHQQDYQEEINRLSDGFMISWEQLLLFSKEVVQIINIIVLGSKDPALLKNYETEDEMYNNCNIFIGMYDGSFWKIFSKDGKLIDRLAEKFNDIVLIDSTDKKYPLEWPP